MDTKQILFEHEKIHSSFLKNSSFDVFIKHLEIEGGDLFSESHTYYWGYMPQRQAGEYVGVLPLILAIIGLIYRRNNYTWFFAGAGLITLLLSMGKHTPVFWLAYKFVYGFSYFRVPISIFALSTFALAILAGRGLDFILSDKDKKEKKSLDRFTLILCVLS